MTEPRDILDLFDIGRDQGAAAVDAMVAAILRDGIPDTWDLGAVEAAECCIIARCLVREHPTPPGLADVERAIVDRVRVLTDAAGDARRAAKYGGGDA